jgi:hypothetical protein
MLKKYTVLGIMVLMGSLSLTAQLDTLTLDFLNKKMRFFSDSLRNSYVEKVRFQSNDSFTHYLKQFLSFEESFDITLDSITTVSFIKSDDHKLRIISWLVADNSGNYKSFGAVQFKPKKGEVQLTWLKEKIILDHNELENNSYNHNEWPGGLIYQVKQLKTNRKNTYIILSFHGLGRETNRKMIDVMQVLEEEILFGMPLFLRYKGDIDPNYRAVFTFSDQTTMTLRFEDKGKSIVFDHLVAPSDALRGITAFLVPDGTYGRYELKRGGKWLKVDDFGTYLQLEEE